MPGSVLEFDCRRAFVDDGQFCVDISVKNTGATHRRLLEIVLTRGLRGLASVHGIGAIHLPALARIAQLDVTLGPGDGWEATFRWSVEASSRVRTDGAACVLLLSSDDRPGGARLDAAQVTLAGDATSDGPTVIRLRRRYALPTLGALSCLVASVIVFHAAADGDGLGSALAGLGYLALGGWLAWLVVKRRRSERPRLILGPDWLVLPERRRAVGGSPPGEVPILFDTIISLEAHPTGAPRRLVLHTQDGRAPFLRADELPPAWPIPAVLEAIGERRRRASRT